MDVDPHPVHSSIPAVVDILRHFIRVEDMTVRGCPVARAPAAGSYGEPAAHLVSIVVVVPPEQSEPQLHGGYPSFIQEPALIDRAQPHCPVPPRHQHRTIAE